MTDSQNDPISHASELPRANFETTRHLAYAEAAMMLIESLMLVLIERRMLTSEQLIAVIESVIATKRQMIVDGEHPEVSAVAAGLLSRIAASLAASERPGARAP